MLAAASRGVKVRFLLDDFNSHGKDDMLNTLAAHPNIDVHLFNPNRYRHFLRDLSLVLDSNHLGKRMHNKSLIADGSVAIIGGRNIGDVYYASDDEILFLDYDIVAVGKVVPEISGQFDTYWNYKRSVPAKMVVDRYSKEKSLTYRDKIDADVDDFSNSTTGMAVINSNFNKKAVSKQIQMIVADKTSFYYDKPEKVDSKTHDDETHMEWRAAYDIGIPQSKIVLISPYFVPTDKLIGDIKKLRDAGTDVTVITNSLASTDVSFVYSGYKHFIKRLIQMGVKMYELKPKALNRLLKSKKWSYHYKSLSLHTKLMVIDDSRLGLGSVNLDPRSQNLNTELFMLVDSQKIVSQQQAILDKVANEKNLYRLTWDEQNGVEWHSIENGEEVIYHSPPNVGFWKKFMVDFVGLLPVDGEL